MPVAARGARALLAQQLVERDGSLSVSSVLGTQWEVEVMVGAHTADCYSGLRHGDLHAVVLSAQSTYLNMLWLDLLTRLSRCVLRPSAAGMTTTWTSQRSPQLRRSSCTMTACCATMASPHHTYTHDTA